MKKFMKKALLTVLTIALFAGAVVSGVHVMHKDALAWPPTITVQLEDNLGIDVDNVDLVIKYYEVGNGLPLLVEGFNFVGNGTYIHLWADMVTTVDRWEIVINDNDVVGVDPWVGQTSGQISIWTDNATWEVEDNR